MQVTLQDLLAEIRNLSYLFYGYTVIWVIILGYLFTLSRRESHLRAEVDELKRSIEAEPERERP
jgi:CcmD family protein